MTADAMPLSAIDASFDHAPLEERLSLEQIRRNLVTDRVGFHTVLLDEVDSTNTTMRRLVEHGTEEGTVVLAESQTMGRGRLGAPWFPPASVNLYASVLLRPRIRPSAVPVFTFIGSLALTDAIRAERIPTAIKWPNDVLVEGRKVAGVLVGYAIVGDAVDYVILGGGVNVNVDRRTLRCGLGAAASAATSLREAAGRRIDRNVFAAAFLNFLERWDDEYRAHGPESVLAAWRERDALAGSIVEVRGQGESFRGKARGVSDDGRLIVEGIGGERREVVTGEVVVID